VIYLDSSVVLAHLLSEARRASADFWEQDLASSKLLEYEVWNRLHARGASATTLTEAERLIASLPLVDLTAGALARALRPFPVPLRTLDGLHLATADHLRASGEQNLMVATHDLRLHAAAEAMGFATVAL
jgi:predicted nucleic acid-binding protein